MIKYTNNIEDFYTSNNEKRGEERADVNQIKGGGGKPSIDEIVQSVQK